MLKDIEMKRNCISALVVSLFVCCSTFAWSKDTLGAEQRTAISYFDQNFAATCQPFSESKWLFEGTDEQNPVRAELNYRGKYDASGSKVKTDIVYQFFCSSGAYNRRFVYLKKIGDVFDTLSFATPELQIEYEDRHDEKVEEIKIIGFASYLSLTNSFLDLGNLKLIEKSYWRGLGDAYHRSTYLYSDGQFILKSFEVDASYDGEVEPQLILNY